MGLCVDIILVNVLEMSSCCVLAFIAAVETLDVRYYTLLWKLMTFFGLDICKTSSVFALQHFLRG